MKVLSGVFPRLTEEQKNEILKNGGEIEEKEGFEYVYKERRAIQDEIEKEIQNPHR